MLPLSASRGAAERTSLLSEPLTILLLATGWAVSEVIRCTETVSFNSVPTRLRAFIRVLIHLLRIKAYSLIANKCSGFPPAVQADALSGRIPLFASIACYPFHSCVMQATLCSDGGAAEYQSLGSKNRTPTYPQNLCVEDDECIDVELKVNHGTGKRIS